MDSLRALGAAAVASLPELRQIVAASQADPDDFRWAYSRLSTVPEHVRAHWAIIHIEACLH